MKAQPAKTTKGATVYVVHFDEGESPFEHHSEGLCIACGEFADGVEPDARRYDCEACGKPKVYGLEELVMMGYCR